MTARGIPPAPPCIFCRFFLPFFWHIFLSKYLSYFCQHFWDPPPPTRSGTRSDTGKKMFGTPPPAVVLEVAPEKKIWDPPLLEVAPEVAPEVTPEKKQISGTSGGKILNYRYPPPPPCGQTKWKHNLRHTTEHRAVTNPCEIRFNKTVLLRDRKRRTTRAPPTSKSFQNICPKFCAFFVHFLSKTFVQNFWPKLLSKTFFVQNFCPKLWGGGGRGQGRGGGVPTLPMHCGIGPPSLWTDTQSENITFARFAKRAVTITKLNWNLAKLDWNHS